MIRGQNPHGKYDMMYRRTTATAGFDTLVAMEMASGWLLGNDDLAAMETAGALLLLLGNSGAERNSSPAYE